jgi:hypothetical protein
MTREDPAATVEAELAYIPEGEGPQQALRSAYREMRLKSLSGPADASNERKAVFHDALMSVFKTNPQFRFRYDGSFFGHT